MEVIIIIIGLVVGAGVGWLIARLIYAKNQSTILVEQEKVRTLSDQLNELKAVLATEQKKTTDLIAKLSVEETTHRGLQIRLEEQKKEWEILRKKFTDDFEHLTAKIFDARNKEFVAQSKNSIGDLLKPLRERIVEFESKIDTVHKDSIAKNQSLFSELKHMKDLNLRMGEEARNLTRALKGDVKQQGNWGEVILDRILEKSGLEEGREYSRQSSSVDTEGRRQVPDVTINLPGKRHVIIDAKVSLKAYEQYVNAEQEEEKAAALKAHLLSVRQHMKVLASKNYQNHHQDHGLDFVILFVPLEPAYMLAIQNQYSLYEEAFEKRIVLVSPTLLIPSLQLIKNIWKREYQNSNVIEIAKQAGNLHDKFVGFIDDLKSLGKHLDKSKEEYEGAINKLSEGKGSLVTRVAGLKKLGAKANKTIDVAFLEKAETQNTLFD